MFKAIGRWGSQVRSSINLRIFSNIFGSKSKKYGDLSNEDEEIFIDAQEDISPETDTEEDRTSLKFDEIRTEKSDSKPENVDGILGEANGEVKTLETIDVPNNQIITEVEVVEVNETHTETSPEENELSVEHSPSQKEEEKEKESSSSGSSDDNSESEHDDDGDDHHINHKDTKQMVKNSKQNNGIVQSASSSMLQKVHRRMNSYSQRQYAKFDNSQDDENENKVQSNEESTKDTVDSYVVDDTIEQTQVFKSEKKSKRKKKISKRTRKAVRGTWKWFKRSMTAYASTFNFSAMFVVNIASAAKK